MLSYDGQLTETICVQEDKGDGRKQGEYEKKKTESEKWSERGKGITNEATERKEKRIKIEEKEKKERKMQRFLCYLCDKLMKNRKQKLVHFTVTNNPVDKSSQGSVRTISASPYQ